MSTTDPTADTCIEMANQKVFSIWITGRWMGNILSLPMLILRPEMYMIRFLIWIASNGKKNDSDSLLKPWHLDSGYLTTPICKELKDQDIFAVIAHRRFHSTKGLFPKWKFHYD